MVAPRPVCYSRSMSSISRMLRIAPLIAVVASACGSSPDQCPIGPPVSPDATIPYQKVDEERCRFWERCDPDQLSGYTGGTVDGCIDYYACVYPYPAGWTVTPQCIDHIRAASCGEPFYRVLDESCTLGGPVPLAQLGELCRYDACRPGGDVPPVGIVCDDGLYCDSAGVCRTSTALGQPCSIDDSAGFPSDPCGRGAFCDFTQHKCTAYLHDGDACVLLTPPIGWQSDPCTWPSTCTDGICTPRGEGGVTPGLGESCPDGYCLDGLACVDGTCEQVLCSGGIGDACHGESCDDGLVCSTNTCQGNQ